MALVPVSARNRVSPLPVSTIEQSTEPYVVEEPAELCTDPDCAVCRGEGDNRHRKHHKHHHHKRHHHKKHHSSSWNELLPREESGTSILSARSITVSERRPQVTERALVPVNQTERQVVTTTQNKGLPNEEVVQDAWVSTEQHLRFNGILFSI